MNDKRYVIESTNIEKKLPFLKIVCYNESEVKSMGKRLNEIFCKLY